MGRSDRLEGEAGNGASRTNGRDASPAREPRERIGVVGAGTMGIGVAHALAEAGRDVVLIDVSTERLQRALTAIGENLRYYGIVEGRRRSAGTAEVLARIDPRTDPRALEDVGFVVENVTERWEVKRDLYVEMDRVCRRDVAFAVNTSAIPITRVAECTRRPDRVVGMHFMNPVPLMPVVEIVRGAHTSDETIAEAEAFLATFGKDAVVVADSPGFVTNRVMMLVVNEAVALLEERIATAEQIDRLFTTCFGHKMGPFETADLIGLDTVLYSLDVLHECLGRERFRPRRYLRTLVESGRLGRKSGRGFYLYDDPDLDAGADLVSIRG